MDSGNAFARRGVVEMGGPISLARASLWHDWRRYLTAVLAVAFTGLLIVAQSALLLGLFGTVSLPVDASRADIWLGSPNTESVDLGQRLPLTAADSAHLHPGVARVERYLLKEGELIRPDGATVLLQIHAIDPDPAGLAFAATLSSAQRKLLEEPGAALVDVSDLDKFGARKGDTVEINGRQARIVGVLRGLRALAGANVLIGLPSIPLLLPHDTQTLSYGLLSLDPAYDADEVAQQLMRDQPRQRFEAWSAEELSTRSRLYWLLESGAGIASGVATLLSLLVGVAITSQTLSGAILASLREFATLRALGVPQRALASCVLEMSAWVGLAGLLLAGMLSMGLALLGRQLEITMAFPVWMLLASAGLILLIALLSGLLALRPLRATEPAELLR
ncbi:hypothetical protein DB032_23400 [Chromobacterium sp. Panama]|uniref:ABC transporter permease n=1 Tax=Chromobacterium sp. Panama TaxID=2161826 RepID=UPI000D2F71C5|nr:ABC transporter permease [Chromobacterium sp. Panama]PTU63380.1 hypothetical protein DB032_23400 [Chromobacterium sp. Panama]